MSFPICIKTRPGQIAFYFLFLVAFPWLFTPLAQGKEKDTCSISLVQQAKIKKMEGKEVISETYQVKDGDHIWELLRQRGLLERPDLDDLIALLKSMNKSLANLDIIHPGQTILIPLNITPIRGDAETVFQESIMDISSLKDINFENYVVKPGDSVTMIVYGKYKIPPKQIYYDYLDLVQKFNPNLKNINTIYPNQVIRLPIFSPEMVRMPIKATKEKTTLKQAEVTGFEAHEQTTSLRKKLRYIFTQMGEEWVDIGDQFIPLKAGGQIHLKAESFPVLNLASGMKLIIDIKDELPKDISQLILAAWNNYGIVHLNAEDSLTTAIDKILAITNYEILKPPEQFKVRSGNIGITIAGDWVIIPDRGEKNIPEKLAVINLIHSSSEETPVMIKSYLKKLGIEIIDYAGHPAPKDTTTDLPLEKQISVEENTDFPLPTLLLNLAGQTFSSSTKIPVYQGGSSEFNLIIQADLFFQRKGKDCIITKTDLSPTFASILKKHQFQVLSLGDEKNPSRMTELLLDFLEVSYDSNPHHFLTGNRDKSKNITIEVPGISFYDQEGKHILATEKKIPKEIILFLNQKGYTLLELSQFESQ
ncbi:MAG: LysM peptidoglycan-binding domain-containing protein [Thermodesulfobacteriota bacterium]